VGEAEEVAQRGFVNACEADQDAGVADVMIGDVVDVGRVGEERGAIVVIHANHKRAGFGGAMRGKAGEKVSAKLEGGRAIGGARLDAGQGEADFADGGERDRGPFSFRFCRHSEPREEFPGRLSLTPSFHSSQEQRIQTIELTRRPGSARI
jgi:hypothetical protein